MTRIDRILNNRRLVLTAVVLLSVSGLIMWMTMVRQEDPRLPDFWGQVIAPYPGADAPTVERLVLEPIEDALPAGVSVSYGGDAEGSGEANAEIMRNLPIGILLLLAVLLAEFNSFRRMAIILMTVPLAAAGVIPGLLIGQQPFGFMSLLGAIALVGIVVNNAIVLLEVVESRLKEGEDIPAALQEAVARRIRPILLTMVVVPALYRVLMSPLKSVLPGWILTASSLLASPTIWIRPKNRR
jgi:multidrug efflux pump subunit AcrB